MFIDLEKILILISILYLCYISCYNLNDFNNICVATNWFIHPSNGGVCVFGQIMIWLTCLLLLYFYLNEYPKWILLFLSISWIVFPYLMNNEWLSIVCIPLAFIWILIMNL